MQTATQIAQVAYNAGFRNNGLVLATAIALAESGGNELAANHNGPTQGCPQGSVDRGLWQINDCYHAEVSQQQAYRPLDSAYAAYRISNKGTNFTPWSTFGNGAYRAHLHAAILAVGSIRKQPVPPKPKIKPWHIELLPWTYMSQFAPNVLTDNPSDNRARDCGPTCIAMVLSHLYDVALAPDIILAGETWLGYTGDTYDTQIIAYLLAVHGITVQPVPTTSKTQAVFTAWKALMKGHSIINRGVLQTRSGALDHYTCTTGMTMNSITYADPNDGKKYISDYSTIMQRAKYEQLLVLRARHTA